MRSHEERIAETKRRIAKIEREKRLRRNAITMASAVAACLALLIGTSLAMPGIAANIQTGDYSGFETAASIFHGGAAFGGGRFFGRGGLRAGVSLLRPRAARRPDAGVHEAV